MTDTYLQLFQSRPLLVEVGQERTRLWVHSAILERFPALLKSELDTLPKLQKGRCLFLEHIDTDIFAWCCEFAYTGNYSFTCSTSPKSTLDFEFDGPLAVVIPAFQIERLSRSDLAILSNHSRIHSFAIKYQWESLCLLSAKKLQDSILSLHLSSSYTDEIFRHFIETASAHAPLCETPS